jgi:hypothetical protein
MNYIDLEQDTTKIWIFIVICGPCSSLHAVRDKATSALEFDDYLEFFSEPHRFFQYFLAHFAPNNDKNTIH